MAAGKQGSAAAAGASQAASCDGAPSFASCEERNTWRQNSGETHSDAIFSVADKYYNTVFRGMPCPGDMQLGAPTEGTRGTLAGVGVSPASDSGGPTLTTAGYTLHLNQGGFAARSARLSGELEATSRKLRLDTWQIAADAAGLSGCSEEFARGLQEYCTWKRTYGAMAGVLFDSKMYDTKNGLVAGMLRASAEVGKKREGDIATVNDFISSHNVPQEISSAQVAAAAAEFTAHIRQGADNLVASAKPVDQDWAKGQKGYWNKFVAQQFDDDFKKKKTTEDGSASFPPFGQIIEKDESGATRSPADRYRFLQERANARDTHDFKDGLSPYYARMILLFYAAKSVQTSDPRHAAGALNSLAGQLKLKVNAGDNRPITWANFLPHDGYVYGATKGYATAILGNPKPKDSTGIDCSLLMQGGLQSLGYGRGNKQDRTRTEELMKMEGGGIDSFQKKRLCSEKQLERGDIIVRSGHTYIFAGYTEETPPKMRIIEAAGGSHRTVRDSELEIYPDDPESCHNSVFSKGEYYVLDPTRAAID